MARTIVATVGLNSPNKSSDVKVVQALLNRIPIGAGGPAVKLREDGLFGDKTALAISIFQKRQFGWADCLVAPGQKTLQRLNELTEDGPDEDVVAAVQKVIAMLDYVVRVPLVVPTAGPVLLPYRPPLNRLRIELANYRGRDPDFRLSIAAGVLPVPNIPEIPTTLPAGGGLVLIVLLLLLFIIRNRPAIVPKTEAEREMERELSILDRLTMQSTVRQAKEQQTKVRADTKRIEECSNRQLQKIAPGGKCDELFKLWTQTKNELLRKLNQFITTPVQFPALLKAINDLFVTYDRLLAELDQCLECNKLGI